MILVKLHILTIIKKAIIPALILSQKTSIDLDNFILITDSSKKIIKVLYIYFLV